MQPRQRLPINAQLDQPPAPFAPAHADQQRHFHPQLENIK